MIFFISDNGASLQQAMADEDISVPQGWNGSLNTPLRGEKGMLTEGGIRVPFIMHWKGTIAENIVTDIPVSALDIPATALGLAGDTHLQNLDGVNLLDYLSSPPANDRTLFWRFYSERAVRKGHWKYLSLGNQQHEFLFDMDTDMEEQVNLISLYPEIATTLKAELANWESAMPTPVYNGSDEERAKILYYFGLELTP